jgi:hypothetical protein
LTDIYRPWGPLEWLLPRLSAPEWSLLGVHGTEERCAGTYEVLAPIGLRATNFLRILDPAPTPKEQFEEAFALRRATLMELGATAPAFIDVPLLADIDTMFDTLQVFLSAAGPHVVLDITSMPKWWFFPLIRMIMARREVEDLVVTYTSAVDYAAQLSSDPAPLAPLPTFSEPPDRARHDELIVGIGFAPLSLRELYATSAGKIRYMFPFPPGPPNFFRNWEFLRILENEVENRAMEEGDRWHVHMYDCPSIFDTLKAWTANGTKTSALAPFGPKTLSLAMCVFALAAGRARLHPVHVFYTQPRRYEVAYTRGIKRSEDGRPDIKAYCLRLGGRDVYRL